MSPRASRRGWTPTDVMGFLLAVCGILLCAWSKATNTLTTQMLLASGALAVFGAWLVNSPLTRSFIEQVQEITPVLGSPRVEDMASIAERPVRQGRRKADPVRAPSGDPTHPHVVLPGAGLGDGGERELSEMSDTDAALVTVPAPPPRRRRPRASARPTEDRQLDHVPEVPERVEVPHLPRETPLPDPPPPPLRADD